MQDTVKLRSPYLDEAVAGAVEGQMVRTDRLDLATGVVLRSLTGNALPGSFAEKVMVQVKRTELRGQTLQSMLSIGPKRLLPVEVASPPYLVVEGSVHKALLGHNVHGGPVDVQAASAWFVNEVGRRLNVTLPDGRNWLLQKLDWAEVYDLGSYEAVEEFLSGLVHTRYPRRKEAGRHGEHSFHAPGFTTTLKLYHKGVEFAEHDRRRLAELLTASELDELQQMANRLLRVEVAIKLRKLRADFGKEPQVSAYPDGYAEALHELEVRRLLREGQSEMQTVRTTRAVESRLRDYYGGELAEKLFLTWTRFAIYGEKSARKDVDRGFLSRATYFRHKKQLEQAGCSWHLADLQLTERGSRIPEGFTPLRRDPRRLVAIAPEVTDQLRAYAAVGSL